MSLLEVNSFETFCHIIRDTQKCHLSFEWSQRVPLICDVFENWFNFSSEIGTVFLSVVRMITLTIFIFIINKIILFSN